MVGNQVMDLLREVNYRRTGDGSHYFEPLHIQYIPLRKAQLDIIETQVSETTGELTEFGEETRFSPFTSNKHERWKFNTIQT